ncbi:MAG: dihydroorotate dehydrogenase [Acidimicrobiia bacterium]
MSINLSTTLSTSRGEITLPNPIVAASGSFGHSDELLDVVDYSKIGAITIKSLAPFESPGNVAPRVAGVPTGMMNSVGLPGPHIQNWIDEDFHKLKDIPGRFIMSFWGLSYEDYSKAASMLAPIANDFVALEVNLSCPNVESGKLFGQDANDSREILKLVRAELDENIIVSAKLSPMVTSAVEIAEGAIEGGADLLTLFNTALGLNIDPYTRKPNLGKGPGGYSGSGISPIVQKGVFDVHNKFPDTPIIGTGGVSTGHDAAAMMMCGASAVGVAAATFADPHATVRIANELQDFCFETGVADIKDLIGAAEMPS